MREFFVSLYSVANCTCKQVNFLRANAPPANGRSFGLEPPKRYNLFAQPADLTQSRLVALVAFPRVEPEFPVVCNPAVAMVAILAVHASA